MVVTRNLQTKDSRLRNSSRILTAPSSLSTPRSIARLFCLVCFLLLGGTAATEVKWTPNPEDEGGGPLPLSMKQREQLLQLEQAILSSPDPDATLQQVAASNDMSAADLAQLLQRNSADLKQTGGSSMRRPSMSITAVLWNTFMFLSANLVQFTLQHPRFVTLLGLSVLSMWYICAIAIPQTGFVINAHRPRSILTRGPTTLFPPPRSYVEEQVLWLASRDEDDGERMTVNDLWRHVDWDRIRPLDDVEEEATETWVPDAKKSSRKVQRVTLSQQMIDVPELAQKIQKSGRTQKLRPSIPIESRNEEEEDDSSLLEETVLEECLFQAASLFQSPEGITEGFPGKPQSMRLISSQENAAYGILIVPGMGDWGRYGLLPLHFEPISEGENDVSLTMTVESGGHWDGQIRMAVVAIESSSSDEASASGNPLPRKIAVRVAIVVPVGGKAPPQWMAERMTQELARSLTASIHIRTQQSRARSGQSQRYRRTAQDRALFRRTNRHRLEEQMEDMAVDRRRRWQRKNPGGTSNYRPTGERMRNPNSAISFR
jgi:hypothetical protein